MDESFAPAPSPSFRLIPSRFPPIGLFDTVATAADLEAVMELAGWTNDRLVEERLRRLPEAEWVFGRPNASIVMASFLHVGPAGARFNGPELGAWYASAALPTAAFEVAHHLRREAVARQVAGLQRCYRTYLADLAGDYLDIRGQQAARPDLYASDSHAAAQEFGEAVRAAGRAGILYDSIRHEGGVNAVAFRARNILDVRQADHWMLSVEAASPKVALHRLNRP